MITELRYGVKEYYNDEDLGFPIIDNPMYIWSNECPFSNLNTIVWDLADDECPWLPSLLRLAPNLENFTAYGIDNCEALLHCVSPGLSEICLKCVTSKEPEEESESDLFVQLSQMPFRNSIQRLSLEGPFNEYTDEYDIKAFVSFANLQFLTIKGVASRKEDLLFLLDHFAVIDSLNLDLTHYLDDTTIAMWVHLMSTCRTRELSMQLELQDFHPSTTFSFPTLINN